VTVWWDEAKEQARLTDALRPHALALTTAVVDRTSRSLRPAKADGFSERIAARLLKVVAKRVKAVSDGTRDAVARAIRDGLDQGMSPAEVADSLDSLAVLANGSPAFDELRAETIARTEMAQTLNSASIASYDEFGVDKVEVIDGEGDDECAQANGEVWTLEQAERERDRPPQLHAHVQPLLRQGGTAPGGPAPHAPGAPDRGPDKARHPRAGDPRLPDPDHGRRAADHRQPAGRDRPPPGHQRLAGRRADRRGRGAGPHAGGEGDHQDDRP
jgi:predicted subunit of tRNA(5-methylaminomethyl-2-thiouridylate) methyltransferase